MDLPGPPAPKVPQETQDRLAQPDRQESDPLDQLDLQALKDPLELKVRTTQQMDLMDLTEMTRETLSVPMTTSSAPKLSIPNGTRLRFFWTHDRGMRHRCIS